MPSHHICDSQVRMPVHCNPLIFPFLPPEPLSEGQAAVDVLAIVAYRQPIAREQVDQLRGRPSGGLLNQLVRRRLLDVQFTDTKPRIKQFSTSERFLELFGIEELAELPQSLEE